MGHFGTILETNLEDVINVFSVDVFGPVRLVQMVVPHMPKGGRIINVGSIASKLGIPAIPVYGAAKATLDALTFSMSQEVRPFSYWHLPSNNNSHVPTVAYSSDIKRVSPLILLLRVR